MNLGRFPLPSNSYSNYHFPHFHKTAPLPNPPVLDFVVLILKVSVKFHNLLYPVFSFLLLAPVFHLFCFCSLFISQIIVFPLHSGIHRLLILSSFDPDSHFLRFHFTMVLFYVFSHPPRLRSAYLLPNHFYQSDAIIFLCQIMTVTLMMKTNVYVTYKKTTLFQNWAKYASTPTYHHFVSCLLKKIIFR